MANLIIRLRRAKRLLRLSGGVLIVLLIVLFFLTKGPFDDIEGEPDWGVTFSIPYAEALRLDWRKTYLALLDDLEVKKVRIPAYWQLIEPEQGKFDFDNLTWMLDEAASRDADVLLVVGRRLPRWPECHAPDWAQQLSENEQQKAILKMLTEVVNKYRKHPAVIEWQVDNEPFVEFFGDCPKPDEEFFAQETELVRNLDPTRKIVVTDSGELGFWYKVARYGDTLGSTMYRVVPRGNTKYGFTKWYLPSWFYRKKANLIRRFTPTFDRFIIAELQAEPWGGNKFIGDMTPEEQDVSVDIKQFRKNIEYARKANVSEVYLWGAEWWYWTKEEQGRDEFWEATRSLFKVREEIIK